MSLDPGPKTGFDVQGAQTPGAAQLSCAGCQREIGVLPFASIRLASRLRKNPRDAIALMLAASILIYVLGYATGSYGVGRIVSFV